MQHALVALLFLISFGVAVGRCQGPTEGDDLSRQDLFTVAKAIAIGMKPDDFALNRNFHFPEDARAESRFSVDVSHHNTDNCNCSIDWAELAKQKVAFAYVKATQGSSYEDPMFAETVAAIRDTSALPVGAYHFLTADLERLEEQWKNFESVLSGSAPTNLPPALDLEWNLGPMRADCPKDATFIVRKKQRCDRWAFVNATDIVRMVNYWLDRARELTGKEPVLYTSGAWWSARIAVPFDRSRVNAKILWIADYSKNGLLTEHPRGPAGAEWQLWQFTDGAQEASGHPSLVLDASVFGGDDTDLKNLLGY